jgi:hypothetical protein
MKAAAALIALSALAGCGLGTTSPNKSANAIPERSRLTAGLSGQIHRIRTEKGLPLYYTPLSGQCSLTAVTRIAWKDVDRVEVDSRLVSNLQVLDAKVMLGLVQPGSLVKANFECSTAGERIKLTVGSASESESFTLELDSDLDGFRSYSGSSDALNSEVMPAGEWINDYIKERRVQLNANSDVPGRVSFGSEKLSSQSNETRLYYSVDDKQN